MSHELRTPLNAIIGFSEVLLEHMFGELNEKQDEYVDDVLSSGRHLLSLINDILDFESSYHLYFLEELFPFPSRPPNTFLNPLLSLLPATYHNFISRIILTFSTSTDLSLGKVILREHLLIKLPNSPITYIEGILPPTSLSPNTQLYIRTWSLQNRRKRTHASLLHQPIPIPDVTVTTAPPTALTTQRYIYSALGFAPQHATYLAVHLQQLILPRKCHPFSELYSPHHLSCAFNDTITNAWLSSPQELHHSRIVYTDGSQKPSNQPLTLQPPHLLASLSTALIFPTLSTANLPWPQRRVIAIKIDFPASSSATNYTA
jgi:hypothetical protein